MTTYVALVHGAATDDPNEWAETLFRRVIGRWAEREDYDVRHVACEADCALEPDRHRHLLVTRGGHTERIDLDAVYWGSLVTPAGWPTALRQALHIGGAVLLTDYAAIWASLFGRNAYSIPRAARPGPVLAIGHLLTLLIQLVLAPVIVAGLIGMTAWPSFRLAVADAYDWMTDDDVRDRIIATVTDAVTRAEAEHVVLIGHSQGGSIVLRARERLLAAGAMTPDDAVTTFASADPLLRTVRRLGIQAGLGRYWLLLAGLWLLSLVLALTPAVALLAVVLGLGKLAQAALAAGQAVWLLPIDPDAFADLPQSLAAIADSDALRWPIAGFVFGLVPAIVAGLAISALLAATGLTRRILAGPDDVPDTPVPRGHDVVASHDPLAPPARAIDDRRRFRQIPQTGSVLLDHETYYRNAATALGHLFDDVWHVPDPSGGNTVDARPLGDLKTLTRRYRAGLHARRIVFFLLWAACCAGAIGVAGHRLVVAVGLLVVVSAGSAWGRLVALWRWMVRMDLLARTGPHVLARIVRARRRRRSPAFTVILFAASALAIGGGSIVIGGAAAPSATQPAPLSLALLVLGAALLASAIASMAGSGIVDVADIAGMIALLIFAVLWLIHGPTGWIAVAVAVAAIAFRAVRR